MTGLKEYGHVSSRPAHAAPLAAMTIRCVPLDMVAHWLRCGSTADYLAQYLGFDLESQYRWGPASKPCILNAALMRGV